ncbi:hypothetical protein [Compostibacter hankyongensis]|uniref:Uncharacterized protein n=1 Tax=Compostibacter hankyongensis TaxID=1007089 RepID=A0ABP8FD69_9BACT
MQKKAVNYFNALGNRVNKLLFKSGRPIPYKPAAIHYPGHYLLYDSA